MSSSLTHRYTRSRVLEYLRQTGRSPKWVAEKAGYDRSYLYKIEAGEKPVTDEFITRMCDVLQVTPSTLFFAPVLRESSEMQPQSVERAS